mmetsp:Transcript_4337/g.7579  ORF Transcript_4337/g.7579 Transcript_4337/m.7579 type:complete len:253 (-) Transcript_4337:11-769(-)
MATSSLASSVSLILMASVLLSAHGDQIAFISSVTRGCRVPTLCIPVVAEASWCASKRPPLGSIRAEPDNTEEEKTTALDLATPEDIIQFGKDVGVDISFTTLGPGFRAVARPSHDDSQIIGYVEGFLRPGGQIIHLDKMEVWKKAVDRARKENPDGYKNGGNVFGVGLVLGYLCLLHEEGCTTAEFLAIDDEEYQHKRLVRYYQRSGFKVIRYVGEDISNIPDRLIWGGCGTLMREDVLILLGKWTKWLFGG